ncbi:MAG TPA: zinc finger Ran-binding domain-containing protein [Pirellulales bacterium]|nr:zinc finger Ran-binding domain-containing protein [Pirellulales bacterium]
MLVSAGIAAENLVPDPSFEEPMPKNQFGHVFKHWGGWLYEGECEFRVSDLAHSGQHSLLIVGRNAPKIRAAPAGFAVEPGRYRVTAYLRGLDIGVRDGATTELMFDGKYIPLRKSGTFGWSKLTYVADIGAKAEAHYPSFGLWAPGYLWVDDVSIERVAGDVPLTPDPLIAAEERPIAPPAALGNNATRCPECGYRNPASSVRCYACGTALEAGAVIVAEQLVKSITSFEDRRSVDGGKLVAAHVTDGRNALLVEQGYAVLSGPQDWSGYDYLKADVYTDSPTPLPLYVEVQDQQTRDYWTRVNYTTVVPPGASALIVPTALYVGEKSRPGRSLDRGHVTKLVFSVGEHPPAGLYLDHLRLERDTEPASVQFAGLWAFDVGPAGSPLMEGFTALDFSKTYTPGRGYGWKNARLWRGFDALQPDPLYQDFLCIEQGGLAIDLPNGTYHVVVNMDSPSGFWGEVQRYRRRALILEGRPYVDTMDLASFKAHYYRNWDRDDLPSERTFDVYQVPYFGEKQHEVEVRDGQLNIDFEGSDWACTVSSVIVYPDAKADQGRRFVDFVRERRRFHFDNAFKRVLPAAVGQPTAPTDAERARGFVAFVRDPMNDVNVLDGPLAGERVDELRASAFAGEYEPVTVSLLPLRDEGLGRVKVSVDDLKGPAAIGSAAIDVGYVQHRLSRVTSEGSVYTIAPRWIVRRAVAPVPAGLTRTFWLTIKTPADAPPGEYRGAVRIETERGGKLSLPLRLTVRKGTLDPVDLPAGPFSHTIDLPWYDDESATHNREMASRSLAKMREYGFTTASGLPVVKYLGFKDGVPQFDFAQADVQMELFRQHGFEMPVVSYCPLVGLNLYGRDEAAMNAAGLSDYSQFIKRVFTAVQAHAQQSKWLPVYWNIGDEPLGDDLTRSAENAETFRRAFPLGPPQFTIPSSFAGTNAADPHFRLAKAVHIVAWNLHDAASVDLLHKAGGDWAFYNGGDRWTYGVYMYKAAKRYGMKYRLSWHWNATAGDPYYPLDCREDDYAWCNSTPDRELIPAVQFERIREGLDDYRRLITLDRLVAERPDAPAAKQARKLIDEIMGTFELGDREPRGAETFTQLRSRLDAAIEGLR